MLLPVNARRLRAFAVASAASLAAGQAVVAAAQTPDDHDHSAAKPAPKPVTKKAPLPKLPANVYARVGGQDITTQEIVQFLVDLGGYPLVRQKVQVIVAEREAKKLGVTVTKAELDKEIEDQKRAIIANSAAQGTPMNFEDFSAQQGINEGLLRQQKHFQLLLRKCFAKSYVNGAGKLNGKKKVSHILIASRPLQENPGEAPKPEAPGDAAKQDAEALVKVKQVQTDIAANKFKTFAEAVTKYSDDPSKVQNNGDLGWIDKNTGLVPEFLEAALALTKIGQVSAPIKTQFGYHLIRLDGIGDTATPAQRAAYLKQIETTVDPKALEKWFNDINNSANVVYNPQAKINVPPTSAAARKPVITSKRKI
jgi:parvulin-like peptidyl-prolyl isomerase